jgi:hypothetical protein
MENNSDFSSSPTKNPTIGFFRNITVNPVQANTNRIIKTLVAETPHLLCNLETQPSFVLSVNVQLFD